MMKKILVLVALFSIVLYANADRGVQRLKEMRSEQRVALVIGNNNYEHLKSLKNPINDARLMKKVLKQRGFDVIYKENATSRDMKKLVKKFGYKLQKGGIGLYYFAGHGVNVDGKNYLVGINSLMEDRDEVEYETLALNYVTKKMKNAGNRLNIIILDACRNNPFGRGGGGGLAPVSNAKGIFIAYATEAGSVASDGKNGENGIFTKYLVKNIKERGATIERVFKNTRADVFDVTDGKQSPGVYNQIRGDFFFTLPDKSSTKKVDEVQYKTNHKPLKTNVEQKFSLTIYQTPSDARVAITNIKPRYYDGIKLKKGMYKIRVTKRGYATKWFKVNLDDDFMKSITLKKVVNKKVWKDKGTGLIWQVDVDKKEYNWYVAKSYCRDLTLGGYSNWKLPTKDELKTIMTKRSYINSKSYGGETYIKKPLLESLSMYYPDFCNSTSKSSSLAWDLNFNNGYDFCSDKSDKIYVRCVVGRQ